jgi:hypothetical protein
MEKACEIWVYSRHSGRLSSGRGLYRATLAVDSSAMHRWFCGLWHSKDLFHLLRQGKGCILRAYLHPGIPQERGGGPKQSDCIASNTKSPNDSSSKDTSQSKVGQRKTKHGLDREGHTNIFIQCREKSRNERQTDWQTEEKLKVSCGKAGRGLKHWMDQYIKQANTCIVVWFVHWMIKTPSCSNVLSTEHMPKLRSPLLSTMTSPCKWKILERDVKQ